jgi:putative addiction module antidote
MNKPLKLIAIGNSTGVILPKEMLARLRVGQGDSLSVVEIGDGVELRAHDPGFETQMEVAREVMKRRRRALRELAK